MRAVVPQCRPHLRQMDLRALVRPAEGRCEQAEHEPLDPAVETELVPAALDRVSAIGYELWTQLTSSCSLGSELHLANPLATS